MIINGGRAGNVGFWSSHLQRDDTNDRAEVMEIKGLLSEDLPTALREMQAIGDQSRSKGNFLYQANLNPEAHEHLTPEQWTEAIDILEKKLGFEGHQRIVVEHEKNGRVHRHVIWNRVDVETLKVADITGNYRQHIAAAREIEQTFDLTPTPSPDLAQKPARAPELWEIRAAERSGIDPAAIKQDITELWRSTDGGKAFAAAVNGSGYILAKGDRRDFCIVDQAGDVHSLARRIDGANTREIRERLGDIDRDSLPSVADARQQQREAYPTPEAVRRAWEGRQLAAAPARTVEQDKPTAPELKGTAAEVRLAWSLTGTGQGFADALEDKGLILARASREEAIKSEHAHAFAKEVGNYAPRYREGELLVIDERGRAYQITPRTTGDERGEIEKRLANIDTASLGSIAEGVAAMKENRVAQFKEQKTQERDEKSRAYWQGKPETAQETLINQLAYLYDDNSHFRLALQQQGIAIARVDAQGIEDIAAAARDRFATTGEIAPRPNLREGEIVAVNRYGDVSRLNPEKVNIKRLEAAHIWGGHDVQPMSNARDFALQDRAAEQQQRGDQWQEKTDTRADARAERDADAQSAWKLRRADHLADRKDAPTKEPGLQVMNKATGTVVSLASFVDGLLASKPKMPPEGVARIQAQRRALAALERLRESDERGENYSASDVASLLPTQLENIKAKSYDDGMRELIENKPLLRIGWVGAFPVSDIPMFG
jgi:hypothetical protein